jgi:hypothetical protein
MERRGLPEGDLIGVVAGLAMLTPLDVFAVVPWFLHVISFV